MSAHNDALVNEYVRWMTDHVDAKGMQPFGWSRCKDDKREVFFLAVGPEDSARLFWQTIGMAPADKQREELLWGWDMTTLPGQGTEFADAYVFVHWTRVPGKKLACAEAFRVGVINYQHEPRIVRPVDWNNEYWTGWVRNFLGQHHPPFLLHFMDKEEATLRDATAEQ